jgi:hypothetical protein
MVAVAAGMWVLGLCVVVDYVLCNHAALPECVKGVPVLRRLGEVWAVPASANRRAASREGEGSIDFQDRHVVLTAATTPVNKITARSKNLAHI